MSDQLITQIYGIRTLEDALMCAELGVDHIGIEFGEIKRTGPWQKSVEEAKAIFERLPKNVVKVGLTIASDVDEIVRDLSIYCPDVLHLSGNVEAFSPEKVKKIKALFPTLKIMQAMPVLAGVPFEKQWPTILKIIRDYESVSDFFLIDTKDPKSEIGIGVTGLTHDWQIDRAIIEATNVPCIIAGGLDGDNVAAAIHKTKPYGVDSNSRTSIPESERAPHGNGKDREKVKAFVEAALNA